MKFELTQKKNEKEIVENLEKLFDIAHADALNQLKEEDAQFLINQRKPNREGSLDVNANAKEKRREICIWHPRSYN